MKFEIYSGTIKKCNYKTYFGNKLSNIHNITVETNVYFVKVCENGYVRIDELLDENKETKILRELFPDIKECFVADLQKIENPEEILQMFWVKVQVKQKRK